MKNFTVYDIRSWNPCYDPSEKFNEVFTEQWSGTALDFLKLNHIPAIDRLWAVCRNILIDDKTLRLFSVWCAKQVLPLVNAAPASLSACDVAERYANGNATQQELHNAWKNAADICMRISSAVDRDAAWAAAWTAGNSTYYDAAWAAVRCSFWVYQRMENDLSQEQVEQLIQMLES